MKKFLVVLVILNCSLFSQVFWNEVTSPVATALRCVSNIDGTNAWICGASGVVLKTSNSGYNWTSVGSNGIPNTVTLINIYGINATKALTAGYTGTNTFVYRTSNSGANWTQVFTETNGFINGLWMVSANNGFMEGDPVSTRWSLWKTTNGGVNWDSTGLNLPKTGTDAGWNSSLWLKNNNIWFGTNNTRIYYSSNYGTNWAVQSITPELNIYSIALDSSAQVVGFAGGTTNLFKTTNGGVLWSQVSAPSTGNINGVALIQSPIQQAWFVRSGTSIYNSPLSINNWQVQYTASAGTYNHLSMARIPVGPGFMYAVRSNGGISRGNFGLEGVKIISNEIPKDFRLYQNYPNPFNPQTKIKFNLPKLTISNPGEIRGAQLQIKVYDVTGKEVETLVNQVTQPGVYEDSWDGTNYPSGIYYYQLTIVDPLYNTIEYRETKKMVLVK